MDKCFVQARYVDGSLRFFESLKDAFDTAKNEKDIWKISFTLTHEGSKNEHVRFVKRDHTEFWVYEPI